MVNKSYVLRFQSKPATWFAVISAPTEDDARRQAVAWLDEQSSPSGSLEVYDKSSGQFSFIGMVAAA